MIRLVPAIVVRADTSVAECVRLMREKKTGAVLIAGVDGDRSLVGIFTERDLVRHLQVIQKGNHWASPVRTVMTPSVYTLSSSEIHKAPQVMMEQNIEYLPIVTTHVKDEPQVQGMVTLEEVVRDWIEQKDERKEMKTVEQAVSALKAFLISSDHLFKTLMTQILQSLFATHLHHVGLNEEPTQGTDLIILDIDGLKKSQWAPRLKLYSQSTHAKLIILAFTPDQHDLELLASLGKLTTIKKYWVMKKPTDLFHMVHHLQKTIKMG